MNANMYSRVRTALPIAKEMLAGHGFDIDIIDFTSRIPCKEPQGLSDEQVAQMVDWANAHYVVGVAVGLLLNPALILEKKGSVR